MAASLNFVYVALGLLAMSLGNVRGALSDEDRTKIQVALIPFVMECAKDFGVDEEKVKAAKASGQLGDIDPCLIACIFQKTKMLNDKGLFDVDAAEALLPKYISSEDDQKRVIEIIETCKSVNDEAVSDGEKGCERAKLLFDCSAPFKAEFIKVRR